MKSKKYFFLSKSKSFSGGSLFVNYLEVFCFYMFVSDIFQYEYINKAISVLQYLLTMTPQRLIGA